MASLLDRTLAVIAVTPADEHTLNTLRETAERYQRSCGCTTGSVFLLTALSAIVIVTLFFPSLHWPLIWSPVLLLSAAVGGKLAGMGAGRIRLYFLYRSLLPRGAAIPQDVIPE